MLRRVFSENNDFQHLEALQRSREKRGRYHEFFVEGVKPIQFALDCGWDIHTLAYCRDRPLSSWAKDVLSRAGAQLHLELSKSLMDRLSEKHEEASELLAVVGMTANDPTRIPVHNDMIVLVCDRPSSHGNLGTILRSCEALGADGLVVMGHAVDPYDPKTIRASMGTFFAVPVVRLDSMGQLRTWISGARDNQPMLRVVGTSARAEHAVDRIDMTGPIVLLIGNETSGLGQNYRALCTEVVSIPMYGSITSINVACATSIVLYERDRQKRVRDGLFTGPPAVAVIGPRRETTEIAEDTDPEPTD